MAIAEGANLRRRSRSKFANALRATRSTERAFFLRIARF
jgi:hypothetical protein